MTTQEAIQAWRQGFITLPELRKIELEERAALERLLTLQALARKSA